ncbi:MAG: class I SAM-dependent methyltransferase [Pseudomonadota bacterium]
MTARPAITPDGFEALYRSTADPWDTLTSAYEATKRDTLLRACGPRPRARGLELACGIGNNTGALARRCLRLDALDAAPTALSQAARRITDRRVTFHEARLPDGLPAGAFDLIVAAEIVYYLAAAEADRLADIARARLAPGGRIVVLHHTVPFHDTAQPPRRAHERFVRRGARDWLIREAQHGRWRLSIVDRPLRHRTLELLPNSTH